MPSPFPGMDPFLEDPAIFPGLHGRLVAYISEALQAVLPDSYFADIGDRVWVEISSRNVGPDVSVLKGRETAGPNAPAPRVATRSKPVVVTVPQDEIREPFVEIYSRIEGERLVATVEVLSPINKTPSERGRDLYLRKQKEILASSTHLVEIDLLRAGSHTTAVPRERVVEKAGRFDYHVCVHRFDRFEDYLVYPNRLEEPLPEIEVPLLPGERPVPLDLQAVFERSYDAGPYRRRIRYRESKPVPPLSADRDAWVAKLLEERRAQP